MATLTAASTSYSRGPTWSKNIAYIGPPESHADHHPPRPPVQVRDRDAAGQRRRAGGVSSLTHGDDIQLGAKITAAEVCV